MAGFLDSCKFLAVSSGTGDFVVASAIQGYMAPVDAGAANGTVYRYRAESSDLSQWEVGFGAYTSGTTTLARTTILFSSSAGAKISFTSAPNVMVVLTAEDLAAIITTSVDLGNTTNTTLTRSAAGQVAVEGDNLMRMSANAAAQANQKTGSSVIKFVSPGVQQFHKSSSKCWGFTTGSGTPVLNAQNYNITSITNSGVGILTITIATDFSSTSWVGVAVTGDSVSTGQKVVGIRSKAAGTVILDAINTSASVTDPEIGYDFIFFGDQ